MDLFDSDTIVSKIDLAASIRKGTPIHKNRASHGIVYYLNMHSTFYFDTGKVLDCHPGDLIYLPKGANYRVESHLEKEEENYGAYVINFQLAFDLNENQPFVLRKIGMEKALPHFTKAIHSFSKKSTGYHEECMSCLYQIIKTIKKTRDTYVPKAKTDSILRPALDYIDKNFTEETIQIAHLAELCGVSEVYLRALFNRAFSVPPAVYIRNKKIQNAKELLLTGEYSVSEAATVSGFNDVSYFSREFKKVVGVCPSEWLSLPH